MSQPWDPASQDPQSAPGLGRPSADRPDFDWSPTPDQSPGQSPGQAPGQSMPGQPPGQVPHGQPTPFEPTVVIPVPPPAQPTTGPVPGHRRSWRRPVVIGAVVVLVLALLVGIDRATAVIAGQRVGAQLGSELGTSERPDVTFHGFPFLTQLAGSHYRDVEVTVHDLPTQQLTGQVPIATLQADLRDVEVSDDRIHAGSADGSALVDYQGVSELMGRPVAYAGQDGGGGRIRIQLQLGMTVTAGLTVDQQTQQFQFRDVTVEAAGQKLPGDLFEAVINNLLVPAAGLPAGIRMTDVDVTRQGVRVVGSGENLTINR